jgi:signal transduction histidine kinase
VESAGGIAWPRSIAVGGVLLAIALLTPAAIAWLERDVVPRGAVVLDRLRVALPRSATIESPTWRNVRLPHDWRRDDVPTRTAWYRATLIVEDPSRILALYLHQVVGEIELQWNGSRITDRERLTGTGTPLASRPLFFEVPARILRRGDNEIAIRLAAPAEGAGLLGRLSVGAVDELAPVYARRFHVDVTLPRVIFLCLVVVAAAIGALWAYRREDGEYGWLSLFLLAWALHVAALFVVDPVIPRAAWDWLGAVAIGWAAVLIALFLRRYFGGSRTAAERTLPWVASAASIGLAIVAALDQRWFRWGVAHVWVTGALAVPLLPALRIFAELRAHGGGELVLLAAASVGLFSSTARDWLYFQGLLPREQGEAAHLAAPLVIAVAGWIIVSRFARALGESESSAATLEHRAREKERELELSCERLGELERVRILDAERERLQREMHDGIGGRLVSALAVLDGAASDAGSARALLRRAIGDLRLVVDAVESEPRDLTAVLGALRERLETSLRASGIRLEWRVEDVPRSSPLGPAQSLHLTRIVEEAMVNVSRHSRARSVALRTTGGPGDSTLVEIRDDGRGIAAATPPGRGLRNMCRRAEEMGARLDVASSTGGTVLRLSLPPTPSPESGMPDGRAPE